MTIAEIRIINTKTCDITYKSITEKQLKEIEKILELDWININKGRD